MRILVTNNGSHSSEQWAVNTAEMIFDIDPIVVGNRLIAAKQIQTAIAQELMIIYQSMKDEEQSKLAQSAKYLLSLHDVSTYVDGAMAKIHELAETTPWKKHFEDENVIAASKAILQDHLASAQNVERLWFADQNPDTDYAAEYREKYAP